MKRLDSYIIRQYLAAFGFFVLIFAGVIWLTQAVRLIDTVLASGQGARTFIEFSILILPRVLLIVLPLSALGATLYSVNRLYSDSELVVMMAAGRSPAGLLGTTAVFAGCVALLMAAIQMFVSPAASTTLGERTRAIRSDLVNSLIVERQFIHPLDGLTLFISEASRKGEMAGLFLDDRRDPARTVTYSAKQALLLKEGQEARLVMIDGVALTTTPGNRDMTSVTFDRFVFDLSELLEDGSERTKRPAEYHIWQLFSPSEEMLATKYDRGAYIAEGHYKIALPLVSMVFPMIALSTFLAGGYSRSGFGRRVLVAVGASLIVQILFIAVEPRVAESPELWPLMYLPAAVGLLWVFVLMKYMDRPAKPRRRKLAEEA